MDEHAPPGADVAIVFVHGIGSQQRAGELTRWGDALVAWLDDWSGERGGWADDETDNNEWPRRVEVERSTRGGSDAPATAELRVTRGGEAVRVHLVEALWADQVVPPRFRVLVTWSLRVLTLAVTHHVAAALGASVDRTRAWWDRGTATARTWAAARALGTLVAFMLAPLVTAVATPVVALVLLGVLVLGLLGAAVPALRRPVAAVQQVLTGTLGDTFFVLGSEIQRGFVLERVGAALDAASAALRPGGRLVVLAHSQGAWVAHQALQRRREAPDASVELITFGQGLAKIARLGQGTTSSQRVSHAYGPALVPLLALIAINAPGALRLTSLRDGLLLLVLGLVPLGVVLALVVASQVVIDHMLSGADATAHTRDQWRQAGLLPLILAAAWLTGQSMRLLEATPVGALGQRLVGSGAELSMTALGLSLALMGWTAWSLRTIGTPSLETPRVVGRWQDLWASADPVPNGPLPDAVPYRGSPHTPGAPLRTTTELRNHRDPIRDHVTYWDNPEQFVARVAATILPRFWVPDRVLQDGDMRRRRAGVASIIVRLGALALLPFVHTATADLTLSDLPAWLPVPGVTLPSGVFGWLAAVATVTVLALVLESLARRVLTAGYAPAAGQSRDEYLAEGAGGQAQPPM